MRRWTGEHSTCHGHLLRYNQSLAYDFEDWHWILIFLESVEAKEDDPGVFVLLGQHLNLFPPTYIAVCEIDPLRDDGILMADALQQAG